MTLQIKVNGQYLDPKRAAKEMLPSDIWIICPHCLSRNVDAKIPRMIEQFWGELEGSVPRLQERHCRDCGQKWVVNLLPELLARNIPNPR